MTSREAEVIRILGVLHSHSNKFVVIGGYAVSALATHRFSVDCDLVIDEKETKSFEKILTMEGYGEKASNLSRESHKAKTAKYVKLIAGRRVSVDLSLNGVKCRDTGGQWSYETLSKNSLESYVVGVTDSTIASVPRKELLIAMKLHPARDTDLRDIVMLSEGADWKVVADFASTGTKSNLTAQLDSGMKRIGSKEFPSSLKAEFGLRSDVAPLIRETLEGLKTVKKFLLDKGKNESKKGTRLDIFMKRINIEGSNPFLMSIRKGRFNPRESMLLASRIHIRESSRSYLRVNILFK